ncbi:MAG: YraN family protein [Chloroflexota bacterium]|nr:YraN family protein [Chloroflexota bacterium]
MAKGKVGLGRRGETLAARVLERQGFTIVRRNWYCVAGEVDIVAVRQGELTFFEVRTRRGAAYSSPEQSVTPRKRARMEAVARRYLAAECTVLDPSWHLGLVAVVLDRTGKLQRITLYPDVGGEPWPGNFA